MVNSVSESLRGRKPRSKVLVIPFDLFDVLHQIFVGDSLLLEPVWYGILKVTHAVEGLLKVIPCEITLLEDAVPARLRRSYKTTVLLVESSILLLASESSFQLDPLSVLVSLDDRLRIGHLPLDTLHHTDFLEALLPHFLLALNLQA